MSMVKRAACALVALVGVLALAAPAGADEPPGLGTLQPGEWVAFTLSTTSPPPIGRQPTRWSVGVNLVHGAVFNPETALAGFWQTDELGEEKFWPMSWSASGLSFTRDNLESCPITSSSCEYAVTGSSGTFLVQAGAPPVTESFPDPQTVQLEEPPPINVVFNTDLKPQQGVGITLDATGSSDVLPGELSFSWSVTDSATDTEVASATGMVAPVSLLEDGQYCVTVTVSNGGYSESKNLGCFEVTGVEPKPTPSPGPGPAPGPKPGTGPSPIPTPPAQGVDPGVVAEPIVFAPPRRSVPPSLFGGASGEAQVVWLWRPEWVGSVNGPRSPRTSSPPLVESREDIIVGSSGPSPDSDAAPWLAGLAVFGLFGAGYLIVRRRRMHVEL